MPLHQTGSIVELQAAQYFVKGGHDVFFPITINPKADLIAVSAEGRVIRVQAKKASWSKSGPYRYLQVRLIGKKQGDSQRIYKLHDFDVLYVSDLEGGNWLIPVADIIGRTSLCLGSDNPNPQPSHSKTYNPEQWRI